MENLTIPDKDCFNESLLTSLNGQEDLQKEYLNMIQDITCRQEYDNLMRDLPIYDGKNMDLVVWLLQIKKVASSSHNQEYELAKAQSTGNPYKMLKRLGNDIDQDIIKRKMEEVYSPIATKVHATSDLHHKPRPDKALQEHIQNFTNLTEKAMRTDPANITNRVKKFLLVKN